MAKLGSDRGFVWQTHPLYDEWFETWKLAGEVYEGDGGFLDGSNLIAHPRELVYASTRIGGKDFEQVIGEKIKFKRRRALARYENFAQSLIDIFVDHQYSKLPSRSFTSKMGASENQVYPIEEWWQNVDGLGTSMDDWLKIAQTLANVYGHIHVLLDRDYSEQPARTRAEENPLVLRIYTPEDALDWLAPRKRLTAIKFVEAVERTSLMEPSTFAEARLRSDTATKDLPKVQFWFWDDQEFRLFDREGKQSKRRQHGFGEVPVVPFYCRRRARIPLIGRSAMRDPKVFRDHYNLISELRALMRDQTFSLLNIQLAPDEDVVDARSRLGDHAGTDTILWTRGSAAFISPSDGPAARYAQELSDVERKMYRLMGLPWETDSADAESADSRKLKAMDLNKLLAGQADEAEKFEYQIARMWFIGYYGRDIGLRRWKDAGCVIKHPDEFNVEQLMAVVDEARAAISVNLGATAEKLIKKNTISVLVPNATPEQRKQIEQEIDKQPSQAELNDKFNTQLMTASESDLAAAEAEASGGGAPPAAAA
jgi:hypothetical protein